MPAELQVAQLPRQLDRRVEQRLKRRDVAAFVMEPISINLGVLIPERDAIRRVRDICRRQGTAFIADEVASGFGRTGRVFACEHFDLDPDMLCVAKAMSGGLAPIGAAIATVRIQGLAIGIDVGSEDYADAIQAKCRRNGLLVSSEGSTVLLLPSLAIDKRTAARGLDMLARSI